MEVKVCYFAVLREMRGASEERREIPDGTTVGALFDQVFPPAERPRLRAPMMFAVNHAYTGADEVLSDGDEVAFIPPVSGGVDTLPWVEITADPIDLAPLVARVSGPAHGAIATFLGTVRDHAEGRGGVTALTYEAYVPMAVAQMRAVAAEIEARWGIRAVALVHRIGVLTLGEVAVAVAVGAGHRQEAFEACRYAIDRLKETVPIWKREHYEDDAPVWK